MTLSIVGLLHSYQFFYCKIFLPLNALWNPINRSLRNRQLCTNFLEVHFSHIYCKKSEFLINKLIHVKENQLLTLNIFHTLFSAFIVNFEQVIAGWVNLCRSSASKFEYLQVQLIEKVSVENDDDIENVLWERERY